MSRGEEGDGKLARSMIYSSSTALCTRRGVLLLAVTRCDDDDDDDDDLGLKCRRIEFGEKCRRPAAVVAQCILYRRSTGLVQGPPPSALAPTVTRCPDPAGSRMSTKT